MPVFKDQNGKEWTIKLDGPSIKTIRRECNLDLADITGETFERLREDDVLLGDVIYVLCRPQCQASNISDVQFGESLIGDAIEGAMKALREAMFDFFPKWKRDAMKEILASGDEISAKRVEVTLAKLKDPEAKKQFEAALQQRLDEGFQKSLTQLSSATSSPEASPLPPTDSPLPNSQT